MDRQPIFLADADRVEFGRLLGVIHAEHGIEVHAYCLMDNHFHLLLHCPLGGLSRGMHQLCSIHARHLNDRVGRDGPLFRGRFCSRYITDPRYVANVVRYIHRNPLDISDVDHVAQYRWSSHRTYLGFRRRPPWLRTSTVLRWFGDDPNEFADFVDAADPSRTVAFDIRELLATIDLVLAERSTAKSGPRRSQRRAIALTIAERLDPRSRDVIHAALELETPDAVRSAYRRSQTIEATCPGTHRLTETVHALLSGHLVPGTR